MKRKPNRAKQRLILPAVAVLLTALLFFSIKALSPPALADQNQAVENTQTAEKIQDETKSEDSADKQEALYLTFDKPGRRSDLVDTPEEELCTTETQPTEVTSPAEASTTEEAACTEETTSSSTAASPAPTQPVQTRAPAKAPAQAPPPTETKPKVVEATVITTTNAPTKAPATTETTTAPPQTSAAINYSTADAFIRLLNNYRTANGLSALQKCSQLTAVAEKRSAEISKDFSHAGMSKYGNYGENIFMCSGVSQSDVAAKALHAFQNSSGHNMNQLSDRYKAIGVGHYIVSGNTHYLAVVFSF